MRPFFGPPALGDIPLPSREETTRERFAAAVAAGQTIALVVAKDPDAAAVYYFRDAERARTTYERLDRLNARPLVVTISAQGRVLGTGEHDGCTVLGHCAPAWFAAALRTEGRPVAAETALAQEPPATGGAPDELRARGGAPC